MKWFFAGLALLLAVPAWAQTPAPATPAPMPAATQPMPAATQMTPTPDDRAKQWLTLVDDGNYADGYKQMDAGARDKINVDAWTQKISAVRVPLGAMSSRDLKDVKMAGQRATIRYDSAFAHKAAAIETVVLISGKDGWSVADYRID